MKYEIDIEGLPEGWRPKAFRGRVRGEYFLNIIGRVEISHEADPQPRLIVDKIQTRRIVLEDTGEVRKAFEGEFCEESDGFIFKMLNVESPYKYKIWREVK